MRILVASHYSSTVARIDRALAAVNPEITARDRIGTILNELLFDRQPQAIIVDERVGTLRGDVVVSFIRTIPALAELPIILLTSEGDGRAAEALRSCGATSYLPVTFRGEQLRCLVELHISQHASLARDAS